MGTNSPDVFREKLEQIHAHEHPNFKIVNYERVDHSYGVTIVFYNEYLRPITHLTHFPLLLATGPMDLLIRNTQGKRNRFFHTETGANLGRSENEAINLANKIGDQLMEKNQYKMAGSFFSIGYNLCREKGDSRVTTFIEKREKAEREVKKLEKEREAREQEKREREAREQEARTLERRRQEAIKQEAREQEKRKQEEKEEEEREKELMEKYKALREEMNQEANERVAKSSFEQGKDLWSEAFSLEGAFKVSEAKTTFEICVNLLSKAAKLIPGNEEYSNWYKAMQLKVEGNILFNSGVSLEEREAKGYSNFKNGCTLQEQGTQFLQEKNYKKALAVYEEARQKYQEGLEKSNDSRFEACVEIVQECIERVRKEMTEEDLKEDLRKNEICSGNNQIDSSEKGQDKLVSVVYESYVSLTSP